VGTAYHFISNSERKLCGLSFKGIKFGAHIYSAYSLWAFSENFKNLKNGTFVLARVVL
jgi:hypothetical protein